MTAEALLAIDHDAARPGRGFEGKETRFGLSASAPPSAGTFPTYGVLFGALFVGVIIIVGALTFFPALLLAPVLEHLQNPAVTYYGATK